MSKLTTLSHADSPLSSGDFVSEGPASIASSGCRGGVGLITLSSKLLVLASTGGVDVEFDLLVDALIGSDRNEFLASTKC